MKNKFVILVVLFVVLLLGGATFYVISKYSFSLKKITVSIREDIQTIDPAYAYDDYSLNVISQIYEPLYQYHYLKRPYQIEPLLAGAEPIYSQDKKQLIIKLRHKIPYHLHPAIKEDRFVKAQDFINQLKRIAWPGTKSPGDWLFLGKIVGFAQFQEKIKDKPIEEIFAEEIEGAQALDDYTLMFNLYKVDNQFLHYLCLNFLVPIPLEVILYEKNNLASVEIGTGPYSLQERTKSQNIVLQKFKDYRKDFYPEVGDRYSHAENLLSNRNQKIPFLDQIIFSISSEEKAWEDLLQKKIELMEVSKPKAAILSQTQSEISKIISEKNLELKYVPSLSARWFGFNMKDKYLGKSLNLRKAIAYAINRDEYIRLVSQNTSMKSSSLYNPGIEGYLPTTDVPYHFDLEVAKQYLAQALRELNLKEITLTYSSRSNKEINLMEAEFIRKQLSQIGIRVEIEILTFSDFLKKGRQGQLQFWTDGWIYDYPDPGNLIQLLVSYNHPGNNKTGYANNEMDSLYAELESTRDAKRRMEILQRIEAIVERDIPWILLSYESNYFLVNKKVQNFRPSNIIRNFYKYINLYQ